MPTIWVVSESPELAGTLVALLGPAGDVYRGAPAREDFAGAPPPDLLVLGAVDPASVPAAPVMERFLGFLSGVEHPRRAPQPALFIEPSSGEPSARLARALIDDRPLHTLAWPIDPDALLEMTGQALERPHLPASLRERARRRWVSERVEALYAGLDLPALRTAVDPRNAHRPVLLLGEPGTRRALLARYVHNLAEPERERLVTLSADALRGNIEQRVLEEAAGGRATLYLDELDRLDAFDQQELAHFLGASGALAIEPIRWIASANRATRLVPELRLLPWIRVELPAVRERPDREALLDRLIASWSARTGHEVTLLPEAREALRSYGWPGNLRELEGSLEATLSSAAGPEIRLEDVRLGARLDLPSLEMPAAPPLTREPPEAAPPAPAPARPVPDPAERARPGPQPGERGDAPPAETAGTTGAVDPEPAATVPPDPRPAALLDPSPAPVDEPVVTAEHEHAAGPGPAAELDGDGPRSRAAPGLSDILPPLTQEIRRPLLAIRTYASLLEQRPDDAAVRRELTTLVDEDLGRLEIGLEQLERYLTLGEPRAGRFEFGTAIGAELDARRERLREAAVVVLRELEHDAPPARGDAEQIRFAVGVLLDRALRMIPRGGDLYVGSLYHAAVNGNPARHRLLLRFHSPEDVLLGPEGGPDPALPVEVILARDLVERGGGSFAVDTSAEDNVVVIELPA